MGIQNLLNQFLEVPNAIAIVSIFIGVVGVFATWIFYRIPRKIGIIAKVCVPYFWVGREKLPFTVEVTNTNSRQFKIKSIGFEVFGSYGGRAKTSWYELTIDGSLLETELFLIAEGDSTKISFDGYKIANDIADGLRRANLRLISPDLKTWIYITHGKKVIADPVPVLTEKIIKRINEITSVVVN